MRIQLHFILAICLYLCGSNAYAAEADGVLAAIKSINYVDEHQEGVWPGFKMDTIPIIIYFEDTQHSYAYNFTPQNAQWKRITVDKKLIYFLENDVFGFQTNPDDFQTLDGNLVYIFKFENHDTQSDLLFSIRNMINKRFSYYLTKESTFPRNMFAFWDIDYNGFNQMDNVEYTYLEAEALKTYLSKNDIESLKDYLAIHKTRRNLTSKEVHEYEDTSDIRFGIGAYVGYKALNLSDNDFTQQVATTYINNLSCPSYKNVQEIQFCVSLAHYYLTGPALGYALDKAKGNAWKIEIEKLATTPELLLEKIYPLSDSDIAQRVTKAKSTYQFALIKQKVEGKMHYYLNEMKEQQAIYKKTPGIEINLDYRYCKPTKYTAKSREEFDISNDKTLFTYYNMVLECNVRGSLVSVQFKYIPTLLKIDSILNNQFKIPATAKVMIDEKPQTAANIAIPNNKIHFHKLKIESEHVIIQITGDGVISESQGVVRISI